MQQTAQQFWERHLAWAREDRDVMQRSLDMMRSGQMTTHTGGQDTTAESIAMTERHIKNRDELIADYEAGRLTSAPDVAS